MYAIVEIAGLQYKVEKDQQLYVNRLKGEEGDSVTFDRVLLTDNGSVNIGAPVISGASIEAKILEHLKGDKVIVFKKKRRKGYRKKNGHRQFLTKIEITSILDGGKAKASPKKETKKVEAKEETKKTSVEATKEAKKETKKDKLSIVEGIGPKTEEYFNEHGIFTFSDLAAQSVEKLTELLTEKGGIYATMDPGTWPAQAKMAAEGKMDELKAWQDELNAGK